MSYKEQQGKRSWKVKKECSFYSFVQYFLRMKLLLEKMTNPDSTVTRYSVVLFVYVTHSVNTRAYLHGCVE